MKRLRKKPILGLLLTFALGFINVKLGDDEIQALKDGAKQSYDLGLIKQDLNLDDYIDTSFLEKAGVQ